MGDRIAVHAEGRPPRPVRAARRAADAPGDEFVEDFVGADRALKRLALQRVRDVDLWKARARARRRAGRRGPREARRLRPRVPAARRRRRPAARLAVRARAARRARHATSCAPGPSRSSSSTTCCATRSPTCSSTETQYGAGRRRARRGRRRAVDRRASRRPLQRRPRAGAARRRRARRRDPARPGPDPRAHATRCVADNGFCPDWIADNFDRYVDPFWQHVYLTLVVGGDRLRDRVRARAARPPPALAGRRRSRRSPAILYTVPSLAAFFLLLPITGRGNTTALDRARRLHAADHLPQHHRRPATTSPRRRSDAGRGMGLTDRQLLWRVELPLALPEILAGLRIAATTTVGLATLAFFAGAGGLGEQIFADINFKSNVVVAGGAVRAAGGRARRADPARPARRHAVDASAGDGMSLAFAQRRSATRSTSSSTRASRARAATRRRLAVPRADAGST